ncbi:hypothetical protein QBZ16_000475 [Prototheca wickerhamii]|uniref:NADH dehydrogenase [ubiquinone] 1 alpha subcomplex subunit 12 n=1 Tax=Prototheca wickerhamii TaxID=3111 RepID=A0AAD9IMV9_PROWI|nr:hypothetical protein QBZ16_000475 [Prototheca wickerhamii]
MASKIAKTVASAVGQVGAKQTLGDALKLGGAHVILDGNLGAELVEHQPGSRLVGTDEFGNKYFEKMDTQVGRNRWVIFANSRIPKDQDPAFVPPEWHGWLHATTDSCPENTTFVQPIYASHVVGNPTGTPARHQPKGSWFKGPEKRNWLKFQAWTPPKA